MCISYNEYLLKHAKAQEKYVETQKRRTEKINKVVSLPQELLDAMERQEIKDRWKHKLLKENCTPKQIRAQVAQLKQEKQLPQSKKDYRPNIKGIQHVYGENAGEIKAVMAEAYMTGDPLAETYQNGDDIIAGMLKEVILCDYEKRDYQLLPPKSTSQQLEDLTDNVKQAFIRDYKACYNE